MLNPSEYKLKEKRWRLDHLYKIIDKKGKLVTFKMNPQQEILFNALEKHPRQTIPKARQLGISTFFTLYMLDDVLFKPNYKAVLIAHELKAMTTIFERVQVAWQQFPQDIKLSVQWEEKTDNKNEIKFNNYSSFQVALSSRGGMVNHLHISELGTICKDYPKKWFEIQSGAIPSVVPGGKLTIESTAEEATGPFKEFWDQGFDVKLPIHTEKDFQRFFFPWVLDAQYSIHNPYLYKELPLKYLTYQKEFNLTDDQITWYYSTQKSEKFTDQRMMQQYPTVVEECFSSSVDAFFDTENIKQRIEKDIQEPVSTMNGWKIFEKFIPGHTYGMGADPSEGIGQDHSAAVVIDFTNRLDNYQIAPKVVATFKSNKLDPFDFAELLIQAGLMYGGCIIGPERNNTGHAVIGKLKERYRNIYQQVVKDYVDDREVERYGFNTTGATKPALMSEIRQATIDWGIIIPDEGLLKEMESYGIDDYKRIKNDPNVTNHFDMVMALAIAWEMRHVARPARLTALTQTTEEFDPNEVI